MGQCTVIANVRDQSSCGSCWAFGSTSSFESRACIATGKDVKFSVEDTAFCSDAGDGCEGGNSAWDYFQSSGVVTGGDYTDIGSGDTCYPYSLAPCAHHVPATAEYPACPSGEYPSPRCKSSCTVFVASSRSCRSSPRLAHCMWLSQSMGTFQPTGQECTSTRQEVTSEAMR